MSTCYYQSAECSPCRLAILVSTMWSVALVDLLLWYYVTSDVALVDLLLWYYVTSDVALVDLLLWYYVTSDVALVDLLLWYNIASDVALVDLLLWYSVTPGIALVDLLLWYHVASDIALINFLLWYIVKSVMTTYIVLHHNVSLIFTDYLVVVLFLAVVLGERSRFCLSCLGILVLLLQQSYLGLQSLDFERNRRAHQVLFFVPCFTFLVLPVVRDCLLLQDCPFQFSLAFISIAILLELSCSTL